MLEYRPKAVDPEVIEENHRSIEHQLAALRFYDVRAQAPTYAGILAFGKDPQRWLPGAYVQFLSVDGTALGDEVLAEQEVRGDLTQVLRRLDDLTLANVRRRPVKVEGSSLLERSVQTYPLVALRELLLNAVMHRNYESNGPIKYYWFRDRVEIQSPGGLYGGATPENFPTQNDYRNPVVADALKVLGAVNKYGTGVATAQRELAKNGNPPAEFRFDPNFVGVTVRVAP